MGLIERRAECLEGALIGVRFASPVAEPEPLAHHALPHLRALSELVGELDHAVERAIDVGVDELAGGVDGLTAIHVAPPSDTVEVFESEPDRIHQAVTTRARGAGAVRGEPFARGKRRIEVGRLGVDVRRWRRRR